MSRLGEVLTANSELVARPLAISGAVGKIANVGKIAEPVGKIALAKFVLANNLTYAKSHKIFYDSRIL